MRKTVRVVLFLVILCVCANSAFAFFVTDLSNLVQNIQNVVQRLQQDIKQQFTWVQEVDRWKTQFEQIQHYYNQYSSMFKDINPENALDVLNGGLNTTSGLLNNLKGVEDEMIKAVDFMKELDKELNKKEEEKAIELNTAIEEIEKKYKAKEPINRKEATENRMNANEEKLNEYKKILSEYENDVVRVGKAYIDNIPIMLRYLENYSLIETITDSTPNKVKKLKESYYTDDMIEELKKDNVVQIGNRNAKLKYALYKGEEVNNDDRKKWENSNFDENVNMKSPIGELNLSARLEYLDIKEKRSGWIRDIVKREEYKNIKEKITNLTNQYDKEFSKKQNKYRTYKTNLENIANLYREKKATRDSLKEQIATLERDIRDDREQIAILNQGDR